MEKTTKRKIFSGIGIVWGGGIILRWMLSEPSTGSGAYQAGQYFALLLGIFLLGYSLYSFFKTSGN